MRLGNVVKCLGEQAEAADVEVSPGFAGAEIPRRSLRRDVSEHWAPGPKTVPVAGADRKLRAAWQAGLLIVVATKGECNLAETHQRNDEPVRRTPDLAQ